MRLFFFFSGCIGSSLLRAGFSLVAASGGPLFVAVRGLLIAVASLVGSVVVARGLYGERAQ